MKFSLPLDDMTVEEKLQVMEILWDDLARNEKDVPPPAWHGEVLESIEADIQRGAESYEDWETVKKKLREEFE